MTNEAFQIFRTTDYDIAQAMIAYGGSFVAQLGRLILLADAENKRKLFEAFPEYIAKYDDIAADWTPTA